jgi:hypothetical protein
MLLSGWTKQIPGLSPVTEKEGHKKLQDTGDVDTIPVRNGIILTVLSYAVGKY